MFPSADRIERLLAGTEGVLVDHPLLLRGEIDPLILDALIFGGHPQDFQWFGGGAFEPVFEAARNNNSFAFVVLAD